MNTSIAEQHQSSVLARGNEHEEALSVAEPILGREEKEALSDVIDSGWITMGDRVRAFEDAFARVHNAPESVAVSSCTAGLHLILQSLGIGPGDEVLVPSLTFVATVNCVLYVGADPVFVDIESLDKPLISLADAGTKCSARTRAIIVMHYAGYIADRDAWREFAAERNLFLIEDAAHAVGVDQVGTFGHAAAFSFYGNKNMTTAEGGIVTSPNRDVLERVRQMRNHGMTSGTFQRFSDRSVGYDVMMLGYNYRMDELRAAIGLTQLKKLASWNEKRRSLTQRYMQYLKERCPNVEVPFTGLKDSSPAISSHHIMPVVLPKRSDRQKVIDILRGVGIQTSNHYPAVHQLTFYRNRFSSVCLPQTEEYARRELTLPLHPRMNARDVERVVSSLSGALMH
ncbi:MAG TPA: DegT/DnrJ/EryC1/StrS aminotransferase family protein [Pseudolabrys sp.]|nr:DegT/DnrJ/EryC1/StrS aminotransferase family protein [Pseudolabrys sp.]